MRSPRSDRRRSQLEFSCGSERGSQPPPINASWHHHGGGRKAAFLRRVTPFELVARNSPGALSFSAPHCHSQGRAGSKLFNRDFWDRGRTERRPVVVAQIDYIGRGQPMGGALFPWRRRASLLRRAREHSAKRRRHDIAIRLFG